MSESSPAFSADSTGVVTAVGWGDPSHVGLGGTTSHPVESDSTPEVSGS